MRPRTYILALIVSLSVGATLAACQKGQNANPETGNIRQADPPEMISQGIKADYRIAEELNKIPGVQGAAVLIHNGEAYVGAHVIGDEKQPDAYKQKPFGSYYPNGEQPFAQGDQRSPHSGKGIPKTNVHGAPDTSQNGVTQSGQNANEIPNRPGGTEPRTEKAGSATGNVEPELVQQIEAKVKAMAPNVTKVYFTAKQEDVGQLQGYARYIQDGGSMERFTQAFDETVKRIWPTAQP